MNEKIVFIRSNFKPIMDRFDVDRSAADVRQNTTIPPGRQPSPEIIFGRGWGVAGCRRPGRGAAIAPGCPGAAFAAPIGEPVRPGSRREPAVASAADPCQTRGVG